MNDSCNDKNTIKSEEFEVAPSMSSIDQSINKNISINLIENELLKYFGNSREIRTEIYDDVWMPDITVAISNWLKSKKIITNFPLFSGESFPVPPARWTVEEIKGVKYTIPNDSIVILNDCALVLNTVDLYDKVRVEVHAALGKANDILTEICNLIKHNGIIKGSVISNGRLIERSTASMADFFTNSNTLNEININLLNLFDEKRKEAFHSAGMPFKRGVLLTGVPGTGKTTLAKIIEAMNPNVTTLWPTSAQLRGNTLAPFMKFARELAPTIIFMEDLDGIGADRNIVNNELLPPLLNEMDGREVNENIIFIGTTNRPDDLDDALIRPGRFDTMIKLLKPDTETRLAFISNLFKKLSFPIAVDAEDILSVTNGLTQASIEELIRYAILCALHEGKKELQLHHFQKTVKVKERMGFSNETL